MVEFLTAQEQELFRRAQVRQILELLRERNPERFRVEAVLFSGVLAPSATGSGLTLALFEHRTTAGQVTLAASDPLTFDLYEQLAADDQEFG